MSDGNVSAIDCWTVGRDIWLRLGFHVSWSGESGIGTSSHACFPLWRKVATGVRIYKRLVRLSPLPKGSLGWLAATVSWKSKNGFVYIQYYIPLAYITHYNDIWRTKARILQHSTSYRSVFLDWAHRLLGVMTPNIKFLIKKGCVIPYWNVAVL